MTRLGYIAGLLLLLPLQAYAQLSVADPALQSCLDKLVKKHGWQTAGAVTELVCHNKGVSSTDGIAQFVNLQKLSLYKNSISEIDTTSFPQLVHLNVAGNRLQTLEITEKPHLEVVYTFHNALADLRVERCPQLHTLKSNNNVIVDIVLQDVPALKKVYLFNNELEILEVEQMTALRLLDVRHNPMPDEFYDYLDTIDGLTSLHDGNAEDWD